jgi:hypothetical protein
MPVTTVVIMLVLILPPLMLVTAVRLRLAKPPARTGADTRLGQSRHRSRTSEFPVLH